MQDVWNVIQRTLVTGASVSVMAWVASQYVGQKPIAVNEVSQKPDEAVQNSLQNSVTNSPVSQKSDEPPVSQKSDKQTAAPDDNIVVIDVPVPEGRFCGVTQCVDVRGGRVVGLQVKFEKLDDK